MTAFRSRLRRPLVVCLWGLAWTPALFTAWLIARHAVDMPFYDEWDMPGAAIEASLERNLTWADLAAQHNESRMLVTRGLSLLHLGDSHWDVRRAMWRSFLVTTLTALLLVWWLRRELRWVGVPLALASLLISIALFDPGQAFNWLFGIQTVYFLPLLWLLACISLCSSRLGIWPKTLGVALLCTFSTYTFSAGALCWVLSAPWLAREWWVTWKQESSAARRRSVLSALVWVGVLAGSVVLYFWSYHKPTHHPSTLSVLQDPLAAIEFLLAFLGGRWAVGLGVAPAVLGASVISALALLLLLLPRRKKWRVLVFLCSTLATSSILTGGLVTIGRLGFGLSAAAVDRYTTFVVPLYVALALALAAQGLRSEREGKVRRRARWAVTALVGTLFALYHAESARGGLRQMRAIERDRRLQRAALFFVDEMDTQRTLRGAIPYAHHVARARALAERGLLKPGIDARGTWRPESDDTPESDRFGALDTVEPREEKGRVTVLIGGWSFLPDRWRPPDAVIVAARPPGGEWRPVDLVASRWERPDVAAVRGGSYLRSGWSSQVRCRELPPGTQLAAWAFDADGPATFPLVGRFTLRRELCGEEHQVIQVESGVLRGSKSLRNPGWIRAGGGVVVGPTGRLNLHADKGVVLDNGFRVEAGGWLRLQAPYRFTGKKRETRSGD